MLPDDEIPDLCYSEKMEGNDSSEALWNGTVT